MLFTRNVSLLFLNNKFISVFPKEPPARATYAVAGLPKGGLVEIEAIALLDTHVK